MARNLTKTMTLMRHFNYEGLWHSSLTAGHETRVLIHR